MQIYLLSFFLWDFVLRRCAMQANIYFEIHTHAIFNLF
jgi:hypothetical protein